MLRVVKDALNEHRITFESIKNSVTALHLTAGILAVLSPGLTGLGMPFQQFESRVQSSHVFIGDFFAELRGAELVDPRKIATGRRTELDFSHAVRGARR